MHALDALGEPVRRRLVELIAVGDQPAGALAARIGAEYGISQPATSRHLRVLREAGLVESRVRGPERLYSIRAESFDEVEGWVAGVRAHWDQALDALATEVARGRRGRSDDE